MNIKNTTLHSENPHRRKSVVSTIVLSVISLYCVGQDYIYSTIEAAILPTRHIWVVGTGALLVVLMEVFHAIFARYRATEKHLWRDTAWKWEKLGVAVLTVHYIAAAVAHHVQCRAETIEILRTHEVLLVYEATSIFYGFFLAYLIRCTRLWRVGKRF